MNARADFHNPISDMLDQMIMPGDVLVAYETGRLWDIGRAGGFMGHVLLVSSRPRHIPLHSLAPIELEALFPADDTGEICTLPAEVWAIETVESTRGTEGLHKAAVLVYVDSSGRLTLIGEDHPHSGLSCQDHEVLELWQCPAELRWQLRLDLMEQAFTDMEGEIGEFDWSVTTAARAVFNSASISYAREAEVAACWQQEPICTSVVISLWQRYLSKVAEAHNATPSNPRLDPMDLFKRYMPLKADRGLPGELLAAMRQAGWMRMANMRQGPARSPLNTQPMSPATTGYSSPSPPPQTRTRFTPVAAAPTTVAPGTRLPMPPAPCSPVVKLVPQRDKTRISVVSGGTIQDAANAVDRMSFGYVQRAQPAQMHTITKAPRTVQAPMRLPPGIV